MEQKKETKEITLKLKYFKSQVDKENGVFYGGVAEPKYADELTVDISDDYDFDIDAGEFNKNGMFSVEISGTKRALKEMGKFLINAALYKTDDEDYHEHIDRLRDSDGNPKVNLIVKRKIETSPGNGTDK